MILLDTSVLVELFRIKDKQKSFFYRLAESETVFAISSVTQYEILVGSKDVQDKFWEDFFGSLLILPFDEKCSAEAAIIFKELKAKNKLIEIADLFVAATARTNNLSIATLNRKHFERVKDLQLL